MKYVFDNPDQMLDWIEQTAKKLLTISRQDFGKIEIEIKRTSKDCNYEWVISGRDKKLWERAL